jgi:hypothetical protein
MLACDLERLALGADQNQDAPHRLRLVACSAAALVTLVLLLAMCGCCVTTTEHRANVQSWRLLYDRAAPVMENAIAAEVSDGKLNPQSAKNRLGWLEDNRLALEQAEKRSAEK